MKSLKVKKFSIRKSEMVTFLRSPNNPLYPDTFLIPKRYEDKRDKRTISASN